MAKQAPVGTLQEMMLLKAQKTKLLLQIGECDITIDAYCEKKDKLKRELVNTHTAIKKIEEDLSEDLDE